MEIPGARRDEYIYNLKPEDYYQGPGINDYDPEDGLVWMFGIGIKKQGKKKKTPIYVKIISPRITEQPISAYHSTKQT